eukprot:Nk52_evm32s2579 gene=Nk52_evmTU32s2579
MVLLLRNGAVRGVHRALSNAGRRGGCSHIVVPCRMESRGPGCTREYGSSSVLQDTPLYGSHLPLSGIQKGLLAVGSALVSVVDPTRQDMVAALGETTGYYALKDIHAKMLRSETGRQILEEKPRISSKTIDLEWLRTLPAGTLGREYVRFLDDQQVSPDTRTPVKFVDDPELAYVMQRYREIHDFMHTLFDVSVTVEAEIALKYVELLQTKLPMNLLAGLFGPLNLDSKARKSLALSYIPWAAQAASQADFLLNIYYENEFKEDLGVIRRKYKILPYHG